MFLSSLKNKYILKLWCYFEHKTQLNTIVEHLPENNQCIKYFLNEQTTNFEKRVMIHQIIEGLNFLHCQNPPIVHSNVQPESILYSPTEERVKISNFMFAKTVENEFLQSGFCPISRYSSPEFLNGVYGPMTDVYSMGMTIIYISTLREPYTDYLWTIDPITNGYRLPVEHINEIDDFMMSLLVHEMTRSLACYRPRFQEILKDRIFQGCDSFSVSF